MGIHFLFENYYTSKVDFQKEIIFFEIIYIERLQWMLDKTQMLHTVPQSPKWSGPSLTYLAAFICFSVPSSWNAVLPGLGVADS